jgi:hypothetical protein
MAISGREGGRGRVQEAIGVFGKGGSSAKESVKRLACV